jgi:hypothetical protein
MLSIVKTDLFVVIGLIKSLDPLSVLEGYHPTIIDSRGIQNFKSTSLSIPESIPKLEGIT